MQPNNQNDPVLTIDNFGQGFIYENAEPGENVYLNNAPPHTNMLIRVTDPDLVSLLIIKTLKIGTPKII